MDEDRVVRLLEEIRDQQKSLLDGVVNMQKLAMRRQLKLSVVLGIAFLAWAAFVIWRY